MQLSAPVRAKTIFKKERLQEKLSQLKSEGTDRDEIAKFESDIDLLQRYLDGNFVPGDQNQRDLQKRVEEIQTQEALLTTEKESANATLRLYDRLHALLA
jgi:vacuolar-type H+-ATPase subunit I/STV1